MGMDESQSKTTHIEIQLARLDERFKLFESVPKQLGDMERKIDELNKNISSDYVSKNELDRILKERKSGLLSTQGIIIGLLNIILAALISLAVTSL